MKNVLEFIENSAKNFPDKVAFSDESNSITYIELLKMSKTIGTALVKKNNTKNKPIAVFLDKTVFALTAFFGTVYSGNFYTVIDSMMPADRISTIFESLHPVAIITDNEHLKIAESIENCGEIILLEDALRQQIDDKKLAEIRSNSIDTDPLYSLFTTTSTGSALGVQAKPISSPSLKAAVSVRYWLYAPTWARSTKCLLLSIPNGAALLPNFKRYGFLSFFQEKFPRPRISNGNCSVSLPIGS